MMLVSLCLAFLALASAGTPSVTLNTTILTQVGALLDCSTELRVCANAKCTAGTAKGVDILCATRRMGPGLGFHGPM